jgi:hypothetical protein
LPKLNIGPAHLAYLLSLAVFLKLLALTGWTWPLAGVAALLPVAGAFLLHGAVVRGRRTD